ncbi:MAG: HNH endonuclease, partial [Clostridia bacterium]|nr:HNH endonuclease [Clostridia bacterium]
VPVSKGGKSTMDNLRTLCEECNRGKRDKYDKNGLN